MFSPNRRNIIVAVALLALPWRAAKASGHNPLCQFREDGGALLPEKRIIVFGDNYTVHRQEAVRQNRPIAVSVETSIQYATAFGDLRAGRLPPGSVVLFDASDNPEPSIALLDKPIRHMVILHNIPTSFEALENIHGKDVASGAALESCRTLAAELEAQGARPIFGLGASPLAISLQRHMRTFGPDDVVIILSHVEWNEYPYRRTVITLSDGSKFDIEQQSPTDEISDLDVEMMVEQQGMKSSFNRFFAGPTVWTVGCNTAFSLPSTVPPGLSLRTTRTLTYREAASAAILISGATTRREAVNSLQMKQRIRQGKQQSIQSAPAGDHFPLELPPESYQLLTGLSPGNALNTSVTIAIA